jgi:hypothetical protein
MALRLARLTAFLTCLSSFVFAQDPVSLNYGGFSAAFGNSQSSYAIDACHLWRLGKAKKFEMGFGARLTAFFGTNKYYTSAPANLASNPANTDSIYIPSPQTNSFNLTLNFGYQFTPKLGIGFNIDVIGGAFGSTQPALYIQRGPTNGLFPTRAIPPSFNLLLVDNHDKGSLNSELSVRYFVSDNFAIKLVYQHLFSEYTTGTQVQQLPEPNDRFRYKANLFGIGVCQRF